MRKVMAVAVSLGLVVGALAAPAAAGKRKKPVKTTLYMHGPSQFGEVDGAQWVADGFGPTSPLTMTPAKPGGGFPKSMTYSNPTFNDQCSGLPLAFPTFTGNLNGTIVGDAKLTAHFLSPGSNVTARIWADIGAFTACNDAYVEPAREVTVEVPAGQSKVDIVFKGLKLKASSFILVELLAPAGGQEGDVGRLLYDSTEAPTSITFNCIPARGKSCTS